MTCRVTSGGTTYVEEELAVDRLGVGYVREVESELGIVIRLLLQVGGVELFEARNVDGTELSVGEEFLPPTEGVTHELHGAVVEGG